MNIVEFDNVSIQFPGVRALTNVSFSIEKGEIMALCGENGAGKSTLAKILAGIHPHGKYSGEIKYKGTPLYNSLPIYAEKMGIFMVHQDLNLFKEMTIAENIFLSHFPKKFGTIDFDRMKALSKHYLEELGLHVDPDIPTKELTVAMQQMVEIVKALSGSVEVIIFDESTSALTGNEINDLFKIIRDLKKRNITVIFVTHKLDEIFEICDTVTILKDGELVKEKININSITKKEVIRMMIGRELKEMFPAKAKLEENPDTIFEVKNWNLINPDMPGQKKVEDFSFALRKNEIVGLYGLVGAGRTELVNSLFEGTSKYCSGEIYLNHQRLEITSPFDAVQNGISLVTEDRKNSGLFLKLSVNNNLSSASLKGIANSLGVIDTIKEKERNGAMIKNMKVKLSSINQLIESLSGGNQQKIIVGKWLHTNPKVLILDEPTKGIDVGSKSEIYKKIRSLADLGMGILIVSSELSEIIGLCDRVIVMRQGKYAGEYTGDLTEATILHTAIGEDI
jgi:D-xylose transport system ATP-binding protein